MTLRDAVDEVFDGKENAPCESPNGSAGNRHGGAVFVCLGDVQPEQVQWLWQDRIALGKITLIAGDPGLGKSLVTMDLAARVSSGRAFPDRQDESNPAGDVVLLSAEDDPADTIRPRLDAAGADVSRVKLLTAIRDYNEETGHVAERSFSLSRDIAALDIALQKLPGCRLCIIDPITAYVGQTDSHKNADVRGLLAPLAALAAKHRVAIVGVTHLNKSAGANALYRATGSLAFVAAARAMHLVVKDKENPDRRLMLPAKNNLAAEGSGLAYSLVESRPGGVAVVAWEADPVTIRADDALADESNQEPSTALREATDWLRDQLADEPKPAKAVKEGAERDGIAKRTLDRAKAALGVNATRSGFGGPWVWKLPDDHSAPTEPIERQPKTVAHYGDFGALCGDDGDDPPPLGIPNIPDRWTPELDGSAGQNGRPVRIVDAGAGCEASTGSSGDPGDDEWE